MVDTRLKPIVQVVVRDNVGALHKMQLAAPRAGQNVFAPLAEAAVGTEGIVLTGQGFLNIRTRDADLVASPEGITRVQGFEFSAQSDKTKLIIVCSGIEQQTKNGTTHKLVRLDHGDGRITIIAEPITSHPFHYDIVTSRAIEVEQVGKKGIRGCMLKVSAQGIEVRDKSAEYGQTVKQWISDALVQVYEQLGVPISIEYKGRREHEIEVLDQNKE
ncbi:hypothetical protein HY990_05710 [Candidatus Micrarchaeota archaeon]|nr:hypothetical protein [Candidatus Micrarchaeota archaeon]